MSELEKFIFVASLKSVKENLNLGVGNDLSTYLNNLTINVSSMINFIHEMGYELEMPNDGNSYKLAATKGDSVAVLSAINGELIFDEDNAKTILENLYFRRNEILKSGAVVETTDDGITYYEPGNAFHTLSSRTSLSKTKNPPDDYIKFTGDKSLLTKLVAGYKYGVACKDISIIKGKTI